MARLLKSPTALLITVVLIALALAGLFGGALGNEFGGGFIGSPLAQIQIAAEPVSGSPLFSSSPFGEIHITNTMVATWVAIAVLALLSILGTRRVTDVPGRLQSLLETVLEFFLNLCESIAGPERGRRFFPLVTTIFLFVLTANWMGILPGFGTIGWVEPADEIIHHAEERAEKDGGHADLGRIKLQQFDGEGTVAVLGFGSIDKQITAEEFEATGDGGKTTGLLVPFLRSANTDINSTLAIALVAMVMIHWWGLRVLGILSHIGKFLNFRQGAIGLFVGLLEGISEIARVISFTFRLFGNMFAGEVLLVAMAFLLPLVGIVPFLGLELFVGLIQAFIFAMLTLVFAATATVAHGAEDH